VQPAPEPPRPTELRGDAYLALGNYRRALSDYTRTLALRTAAGRRRAWRIQRNVAIAAARAGNLARAREALLAAQSAAPASERGAIEAVARSLELGVALDPL
jgi:hypothetical protein